MEEKKIVDLEGLKLYNEKLNEYIDNVFGDYSELNKKLEEIKQGIDALGDGDGENNGK